MKKGLVGRAGKGGVMKYWGVFLLGILLVWNTELWGQSRSSIRSRAGSNLNRNRGAYYNPGRQVISPSERRGIVRFNSRQKQSYQSIVHERRMYSRYREPYRYGNAPIRNGYWYYYSPNYYYYNTSPHPATHYPSYYYGYRRSRFGYRLRYR